VATVCYYFGVVSRASRQLLTLRQLTRLLALMLTARPLIDIDMDQTVLEIHDNAIYCDGGSTETNSDA